MLKRSYKLIVGGVLGFLAIVFIFIVFSFNLTSFVDFLPSATPSGGGSASPHANMNLDAKLGRLFFLARAQSGTTVTTNWTRLQCRNVSFTPSAGWNRTTISLGTAQWRVDYIINARLAYSETWTGTFNEDRTSYLIASEDNRQFIYTFSNGPCGEPIAIRDQDDMMFEVTGDYGAQMFSSGFIQATRFVGWINYVSSRPTSWTVTGTVQ